MNKDLKKKLIPIIHFSYFNTREIEMVFKYVKELLALVDCEPKVEESHIGIVTPYVRQV